MAPVSIMVVDDDPAFRGVIGRALQRRGHAVCGAAGGAEALRRLDAAPFDVLLTDIIMPGRDGFELIGAARRRHPAILVLAMSGRVEFHGLDLLEVALTLGADGALEKPFSADELIAAIGELTGCWPAL